MTLVLSNAHGEWEFEPLLIAKICQSFGSLIFLSLSPQNHRLVIFLNKVWKENDLTSLVTNCFSTLFMVHFNTVSFSL